MSAPRRIPHPRAIRRVHARAEVRDRLGRHRVRVEIVEDCFLVVRRLRGRDPRPDVLAEYVVDLRFADCEPGLDRRIAVVWHALAFALLVAAAGLACLGGLSEEPAPWMRRCFALALLAIVAAVVCAYRTREALILVSVHGRAELLRLEGGRGTLAAIRPFLQELATHLEISARLRRPSLAEHLRDEMREHFRLRRSGVLSARDYERSKTRILARH